MNSTAENGRDELPPCRGRIMTGKLLAELTWLRVGGPAEWLFQPEDAEDLASFVRNLSPAIPLFVLGAGSNLIVRDGGMPGVVIRLGRQFGYVSIEGQSVRVGAAALDSRVAVKAAGAGLDLTFLRTIPGTIGGAVRMNAGCYGTYFGDLCQQVTIVTRNGDIATIGNRQIGFRYRGCGLPADSVVIEAVLECRQDESAELVNRMESQIAYRNETQPTKIRTAGSTFRNPSGHSSGGQLDIDHSMKAWKLIDDAGMRGARRGNAVMSTQHPNFLVNEGGATATDLEELGEEVRARVLENTGIELEWEILRVGK